MCCQLAVARNAGIMAESIHVTPSPHFANRARMMAILLARRMSMIDGPARAPPLDCTGLLADVGPRRRRKKKASKRACEAGYMKEETREGTCIAGRSRKGALGE